MTAVEHDAVHRSRAPSYQACADTELAGDGDRAAITAQIGRPARGSPAVVHRCRYGLPTVARVAPRLDDGTPFPTTFWLTCPALRSAVGRLEADQSMVMLNQRLRDESELSDAYVAAHERYVAFRDTLDDPLPGSPGSGGMPNRVKCLHVHLGHFLATGDNPIGEWVYGQVAPLACPAPCFDQPDPIETA